ncbi:hypothetical protein TeGR_g9501, partial [Tetraparma gracilis]
FGPTRLKLVRVVESMVLLASPQIDALLAPSGILPACLDLFFSFPSCSMLHQSVANMLVHVIEGGRERRVLQKVVVGELDLLGRLLECFKKNDEVCGASKGLRLGFMGHVIIVCQAIVHATSEDLDDDDDETSEGPAPSPGDPTSDFFGTVSASPSYPAWSEFVMSTLATETAIQSTPLGGVFNASADMSDDFGIDNGDMDIAASMIAQMNIAGSTGVKLGMGGIMESLGLNGSDIGGDDDDDEEDDAEGDGSKTLNYDDIINNRDVLTRKEYDISDDDVVEVQEGSSSEEEEGEGGGAAAAAAAAPQPPAAEAWAAFDDMGGEGGIAVNTAVAGAEGAEPEFGISPIAGNPMDAVEEGGGEAEGGDKVDAWGGEDPFAGFEGSKSARDDFFG